MLDFQIIHKNTRDEFHMCTVEELLHHGVVPVLLDVSVKLPGQNHHVVFDLKGDHESVRV